MDISYKKQASDGKVIWIWEDGLITAEQGHLIPLIGKKKLPTRLSNLFAEAVHLFEVDELWSLFQACKEVAATKETPVPGHIIGRAAELLASKQEPKTAARIYLEKFVQADLDSPDSYSDFIELSQNWLDGAENLAKHKKFDAEFTRYITEAQNAINQAAGLLSATVPVAISAAPIGSVTYIFEELNKVLSKALDEGYDALESADSGKAKIALNELASASRYIKALSAMHSRSIT